MKHPEGKLTCEGTPDQGIGCQGARCVPWVCVDLNSHELVSAHHFPYFTQCCCTGSRAAGRGHVCAPRGWVTLTRKVKTPVKANDILRNKPRLATGNDMAACFGHARSKERG